MMDETGNSIPAGAELSDEIKELVGQLRESVTSWDHLATVVQEDGAKRDLWLQRVLRRVGWVLGAVFLVMLLVLFVVARQGDSAKRGESIKDCTTPAGECFARLQEQRRAEQQRNVAQMLAVVDCATSTRTRTDRHACVAAAIAALDDPAPVPSASPSTTVTTTRTLTQDGPTSGP